MGTRTTQPIEEASAVVSADAKAAFEFAKEELIERLKSQKWESKLEAVCAKPMTTEEDLAFLKRFLTCTSYTESYILILERAKTLGELVNLTATLYEALGEI